MRPGKRQDARTRRRPGSAGAGGAGDHASRLARARRALAGAALAALAVPALAQTGAGGTTPPPDKGFATVTVDLDGGSFDQVLPFDRSFVISGSVDDRVVTVDVDFMQSRRDFVATVDPNDPDGAPRCFGPSRAASQRRRQAAGKDAAGRIQAGGDSIECPPWQPRLPLRWATEPAGPPTGKTVNFRIVAPPLQASSYYVFRFKRGRVLDPAVLQDFHLRARAASESVLGERMRAYEGDLRQNWDHPDKVKGPLNFLRDDTERLRLEMIKALQETAGRRLKLRTQRTYLNDQLTPAELAEYRSLFLREISAVLEPWTRVVLNQLALDLGPSGAGRQRPASQELKDSLDLLHEQASSPSAPLAKLLRALRAKSAAAKPTPESSLAADLLKTHARELEILEYGNDQRLRLAVGTDPRAVTPLDQALAQGGDPGMAAARAAVYGAARDQLARLSDWLGELLASRDGGPLAALLAEGALQAADLGSTGSGLAAVKDLSRLAARQADGLAAANSAIDRSWQARAAALDDMVSQVEVEARQVGVLVSTSTVGSFTTYQKQYISVDAGFLYVPRLSSAVPYIGTNIYLRPVNKNAPLREAGGFGRRFAFTFGLTVTSIADSSPVTRKDLFTNYSLLLGGGYRVTDSIRLGAGALIFHRESPNPLITRETLTSSPYISLSIDWDILSAFRGFGKIFGG
ncbi:MAG TPA: hypothetical protein VHQ90_03785 [Thermoanaerobaculia bacterium]|nr:hypothetical protein [Thermoanaerobaculia bacterium]